MEEDDQPNFSPNDDFETDNRQMVNKIFGGLEVNPPYKYPFIAYVEVRKSARSNYYKVVQNSHFWPILILLRLGRFTGVELSPKWTSSIKERCN